MASPLSVRLRGHWTARHAVYADSRRGHVDAVRSSHCWLLGGSPVGCGARGRRRARLRRVSTTHPPSARCRHSPGASRRGRDRPSPGHRSDYTSSHRVGDSSGIDRNRRHRLDRRTRSSSTSFGGRTPAGGEKTRRRNGQPSRDVDAGPGRPSRRVSARVSASARVPRCWVCRADTAVHGYRRWLLRRSRRLRVAAVALGDRVRRPMACRSAPVAPGAIAIARAQRGGLVCVFGYPRGHVRHASSHRPNRCATRASSS